MISLANISLSKRTTVLVTGTFALFQLSTPHEPHLLLLSIHQASATRLRVRARGGAWQAAKQTP